MKSTIRDILWTFLFAVIAFVILRFSIQTFRVEMPSMKPSIQPGIWVVVDKVSYRFGSPQRGDIVVFNSPTEDERDFIKRVIAIPGDTVEIKDESVYLNGVAFDEPYLANPPNYNTPLQTIPPNEYFVLGDNRNVSVDSHLGWLVPQVNFVGKAWLIVWPRDQWGTAPHYPPPTGEETANKPLSNSEEGITLASG